MIVCTVYEKGSWRGVCGLEGPGTQGMQEPEFPTKESEGI